MMRNLLLSFAIAAALPTVASATPWGTLQVAAEREWTTEKEPRARVSKFRWIEAGRVLEARHGFVSRLQFGEDKFADTVQRFTLDPKTGKIDVTYTYEDGRPPLKAVMTIEADGTAVETFTDAKGVTKRNIYKSPSPSVSLIERQEMQGGKWVTLGTTRKGGLTQLEIAENKRRAEEARLAETARQNARLAAERARRDAELAQQQAYAEQEQYEQEAMQQNMPNILDVLHGMANSINQENQRQQQAFERQMRADAAKRRAAEAQAAADRAAAASRAPSQSYSSGSSGGTGGGSQVIAPNYANSGFDLVASGGGSGGSTYQSPSAPGAEQVKIYGFYSGISTVSLEDAWADAFAACARAGHSCEKGKVNRGDSSPFMVDVRYDTGQTRAKGKDASTVSEQ